MSNSAQDSLLVAIRQALLDNGLATEGDEVTVTAVNETIGIVLEDAELTV